MNKRGQFFLIAAVVIVGIVISLSQVANSVKVNDDDKAFYDLSEEIGFETKRVLDYGVFNSKNLDDLTKDFLVKYKDYIAQEEVLFIYGDTNNLQALFFESEVIGSVGISTGANRTITIKQTSTSTTKANVVVTGNSATVIINGIDYRFELKQGQNFFLVIIKDENDLIQNLKSQLEKHNKCTLSDNEFKQILNHLSKGNIYEKAIILRDKLTYTKDNGDTGYLELINQIHWCKNQYQVTHQVTMEGKYKNRYDVTILINGLPLVQIELKRRGLELKEAFNQTNRYQRHSYQAGSGLFLFIQLFVISNGVNTKYYANNPIRARSFKQTFYWADVENKIVTNLSEFAELFLEPCHVSKMITKYTVLNTSKTLMVLRPYQYYATEAIVERVKNSKKYGYIWHTTGSGKTLTSFKASQILTNLEGVYKVVFVVDRKDLDYQTIKEFNSFSEGSIDATNNTNALVKQFSDDTKLIVTTIQKLNTAIQRFAKRQMTWFKRDKEIIWLDACLIKKSFGQALKKINLEN
ncbi:MAG: DEAD/DEAH box helicase family protein [Bacteroidetes bacterium]|nr:DEAD/DEAH box helicase family protein [Bacteroidota bacterium]